MNFLLPAVCIDDSIQHYWLDYICTVDELENTTIFCSKILDSLWPSFFLVIQFQMYFSEKPCSEPPIPDNGHRNMVQYGWIHDYFK